MALLDHSVQLPVKDSVTAPQTLTVPSRPSSLNTQSLVCFPYPQFSDLRLGII